jgi:Uma2 family endonuclease
MPIEIEAERLAELEYYGVTLPPTEDELPYDDGIPMETPRHAFQMHLLIEGLKLYLPLDCFIGGNMFVYYSLQQAKNQDFKGPDFFVVLDVPQRERKSWVTWEDEGKLPNVIIELLSPSTNVKDKGEKKQIYQNKMRVPEYFWYEPYLDDWAGFRLKGGVYQPIQPDPQGQMFCEELGLLLQRWEGVYQGIETDNWLRWALPDGTLLPIQQELTNLESQRAEQEKQRADRLADRLRMMGIDPDEIN